MPKAVSATEVKNRLGSLLEAIAENGDEVIVEHRGQPQAVIISFTVYEEIQALRERLRRGDALARLRALREEVRSRNQDLTEEQSEAIADRFAHDVIDDLAAEGVVRFERDRP